MTLQVTPSEILDLHAGKTIRLPVAQNELPAVGDEVVLEYSCWPLGRMQLSGTVRTVYGNDVVVGR